MDLDEVKTVTNALKELNQSYMDFLQTMKGVTKEAKTAKKLWRDGDESKLVKLGLALIVFPEPTPISETIGICLIAASAVQKGIRSRALHLEDVHKTFQEILKNIGTTRQSLRI